MDVDECVEKRFLLRIKPDKKLVDKELNECDYDLDKAETAFQKAILLFPPLIKGINV